MCFINLENERILAGISFHIRFTLICITVLFFDRLLVSLF